MKSILSLNCLLPTFEPAILIAASSLSVDLNHHILTDFRHWQSCSIWRRANFVSFDLICRCKRLNWSLRWFWKLSVDKDILREIYIWRLLLFVHAHFDQLTLLMASIPAFYVLRPLVYNLLNFKISIWLILTLNTRSRILNLHGFVIEIILAHGSVDKNVSLYKLLIWRLCFWFTRATDWIVSVVVIMDQIVGILWPFAMPAWALYTIWDDDLL